MIATHSASPTAGYETGDSDWKRSSSTSGQLPLATRLTTSAMQTTATTAIARSRTKPHWRRTTATSATPKAHAISRS